MDNQNLELVKTAIDDKRGRQVDVFHIGMVSSLADYFVICSGTSTTHIRAIADSVDKKLGEHGQPMIRKEGYDSARWILLDFGDIVVHIFHEEERKYYNLERLWADSALMA